MGYSTASTAWPAAVSDETRVHLDLLFRILDDSNSTAGDVLAEKLFAEDGVLVGHNGRADGTEAIRHCRDNAWTLVATRHHTVLRVYTHDPAGTDILLIGAVTMGLQNGKSVDAEFTARVKFVETEKGRRIQLYQVWADSAPLTNALQSS